LWPCHRLEAAVASPESTPEPHVAGDRAVTLT
jgi:hypothetical protein